MVAISGRVLAILVGLGGLFLAEAGARLVVGLGDPPLVMRDPDIDYLFLPSQSYSRFGNEVSYNSLSMRSREVSRRKGACELRVLAVGDSVVNGGVQTDQKDLATASIERRLSQELGREVWVGNASTGGWSPGHMRAWLTRFGFREADAVVFVLNSHDVSQDMRFEKDLGPNFPTEPPRLALIEAVQRYALPSIGLGMSPAASAAGPSRVQAGLEDIEWLFQSAAVTGAPVAVLHNRERDELPSLPADDRRVGEAQALAEAARRTGVTYVDLGPGEREASLSASPYRDNIHLNETGQRILADAMYAVVIEPLRKAAARQSEGCSARREVSSR